MERLCHEGADSQWIHSKGKMEVLAGAKRFKTDKMPLWYRILLKEEMKNANI